MKNVDDDNRTIADMNISGMPWYTDKASDIKTYEKLELTKQEKKAMFIGILSSMLPIAITIILGFTALYLFLDLVWLK